MISNQLNGDLIEYISKFSPNKQELILNFIKMNNMELEIDNQNLELKRKKYVKNTVEGSIIILLLVIFSYLVGKTDNDNLINFYILSIQILYSLRFYDFYIKSYLLFFLEFCYVVSASFAVMIYYKLDITPIIPFINSVLILSSIIYGDAIVQNNLTRSTSCAIHELAAIVAYVLYWYGDNIIVYNYDNYWNRYKNCIRIYLCWFIPYMFYMFTHEKILKYFNLEHLQTMVKFTFRSKINVSFLYKICLQV